MKYLKSAIAITFLFLCLQLFFQTNFWESIEYSATDTFFRIRGSREISNDIVIVSIDDETFQSLDERWPFPREYYAHLIDNLQNAGVSQIVFDVLFTDSSTNFSDSILTEISAKYSNIVFAGKFVEVETPTYTKQEIITPIQSLQETSNPWGIVNVPQDRDGFVRDYTTKLSHNNDNYFSIGVLAAKPASMNYDEWMSGFKENQRYIYHGETVIPKTIGSRVKINYYGPAGTFKSIPFSHIIDDSTFTIAGFDIDSYESILADSLLKNKVVLIGSTVDELHDNFYTPMFSGKEMMPGVEIHANFVEMVKNKDFLKEVKFLYYLLAILLIVLLSSLIFNWVKPTKSVFVLVLIIVAHLIYAYHSFTENSMIYPILELPTLLVAVFIASLVTHYIRTLKERKFIRSAFSHYLAPELVNELLKKPNSLEYGGTEKEITVLFSDIRNFTTYTESHRAKETVAILKEYFTEMVNIVKQNRGIVDKFVGDELMTLFGVPVHYENHAYLACKAALEMREKLDELNKKWDSDRKDGFEIGIGVNTGIAVVGNLGSEQIFDFSAIGDAVNLGARIEAINKNYDTKKKIIISEFTYEQAKDMIIANYLDEVIVKGKTQSVKIYELIDLKK
ncbi:MAG: adenylate/guanylate cyclase domain-containing protein [Candidatus Cloacimonetes bacterium]|nr:adenylate/guanylate cyclase domain-containing protein [Candidatus Cloacimonadota bacterium]